MVQYNGNEIEIKNENNPMESINLKLMVCISDMQIGMWVSNKINGSMKSNTMAVLDLGSIRLLYASLEAYQICYSNGYLTDNMSDIILDGSNTEQGLSVILNYKLGVNYISLLIADKCGAVRGSFSIQLDDTVWTILNYITKLAGIYDNSGGIGDMLIDGLELLFNQYGPINNISSIYRQYLRDKGETVYGDD